jgi:hypothetical protein
LIYPLNYGANPLFHWAFIVGIRWSQDDVIGERPHVRRMLQFCKKRCSFQKARAGAVLYVCHQRIKPPPSLSITECGSGENVNERGAYNEDYRVRGTLQASVYTRSQ